MTPCDTPGCDRPATRTATSMSNLQGLGGYSLDYCDECADWWARRKDTITWKPITPTIGRLHP